MSEQNDKKTERFNPDPSVGLTEQQVAERHEQGLYNKDAGVKTKSIRRIIFDNVFTLFNLLNFGLAFLVLLVGSYKNMLFMLVIFFNIVIGSFQEIRAKLTIDKLSLVTAPRAHVVRGGQPCEIAVSEVVLDDVLYISAGNQICSDSVVISGEVEVNESLLTGESDPIIKKPGDELMSGSFVVSGTAHAKVEHVGAQNYAATIADGAKYIKRPNSEIMHTLNFIVKTIGMALLPIGVLLFCKSYFITQIPLQQAVVSTVAALVGMIPEGLVLLTSVVFAVSVVRLSRHKTLVQQLYCSEALARVDVLCLDKTGTITEGTMQVDEVYSLGSDPAEAFAALCSALNDSNATFNAVKDKFGCDSDWRNEEIFPFSSARKWSGANFTGRGGYVMGAAEFILGERADLIKDKVSEIAAGGKRVLLLAASESFIGEDNTLPSDIKPLALLAISDKIRPEAPDTLKFFREQGVDIKIISGDNALTVSQIARRAGFQNADSYCDAASLKTEDDARAAISKYSVFGRVTPQQKLLFIKELRKEGHTVAMTGDGVNDVLALKEADCGVAMASGSEAARTVADIVLLDSNFASMPKVVREGRRSINNLQRSASLFLTKTIYASVLGVLFIFLAATYPFQPINMTLVSCLTIGFPSFILALEPNNDLIKGRFLGNVIKRSLPAAIVMIIGTVFLSLSMGWLGISQQQLSTLCVIVAGCTGFMLMFRLCIPFNPLRGALFTVTLAAFIGCLNIGFLRDIFSLVKLDGHMLTIILPLLAVLIVFYLLTSRSFEGFVERNAERIYPKKYIEKQLGKRKEMKEPKR